MRYPQPTRKAVTLYKYPPLPKYEMMVIWAVWVWGFFYGWWYVFKTTGDFERKLDSLDLQIPKHYVPFFGYRYKDESNWEWGQWHPFALKFVKFLAVHCLIFNLGERFFSQQVMAHVATVYSLLACTQLFTVWLLFLSLAQGTFVFACAYFTRSRVAVWLSSLPILYVLMHHTADVHDEPFLVLAFVSYTLLSYISFNLEFVDGNLREQDDTVGKQFVRMLFYTFYMPYMVSLVVVYPDFERQIEERPNREREWFWTVFFCFRICVYWAAVELYLHLFYFEAMLNDPEFAFGLPDNEFLATTMAFGQFFHLKYVVIFGVPTMFARIDNMQPLKMPICMVQVTLYSKMWRCFDRGLYSFFKTYIFIPICAPTFSIPRKIAALFVCYGFVLVWHGFEFYNYIWIALSITELLMEYIGKGLYAREGVRKWREAHIGDTAFRRIVAVGQECCMIPAIYANYFFVCGPFIGNVVVHRIFNEATFKMTMSLYVLLTLGYFFVQGVIEMDRWAQIREEAKQIDGEKHDQTLEEQQDEDTKKVN